ncbi:MAG TPA: tetratricopeptide repeat protein [Candidatus Polarisedimenticolaceae bacterium]|nr:tetratricopeptide repeat protein [Candidatus Polarisedimenticolaceae bacterium]
MLVRPAEQSFNKGMEALARGEAVKALAMFEAAIRLDRKFRAAARPQPRYLSFYGLCLGLESHRWKEAVDLCREAVAAESYNPDLHLNLGRVLVAAGRRREGWEALQRGAEVDEAHEGLRRALAAMGTRRRPALPFLPRGHAINKMLGKMAHQDQARRATPAKTKAAKRPVARRVASGRG